MSEVSSTNLESVGKRKVASPQRKTVVKKVTGKKSNRRVENGKKKI